MELQDVLWPSGQDNQPGTLAEVLYANDEDIETWPELPAAPATDAEYVTIVSDFTMKAGKFFSKLYITHETGEVKSTRQGETDSGNYKHAFDFSHPGNKDAVEAFIRKTTNMRGVFIVTEVDGTVRAVGNKKFPGRVESMEKTSGKETSGGRKQVFSIYSYGVSAAPKFAGVAPLPV
jgi:hypothetical protein